MVYLVFCVVRVFLNMALFAYAETTGMKVLYVINVLLYLYLTRLVQKFYVALGKCDPARLEALLARLRIH